MKTLINVTALAAIVASYAFSISLFTYGNPVAAYTLIMASIAGLIFWIRTVSEKPIALKLPSLKAVFNLVVLAAIVTVYILSTTLYSQGYLVGAYSLILGSILSFIFWIQDVSIQLQKQVA
jgi:hypothetical protein